LFVFLIELPSRNTRFELLKYFVLSAKVEISACFSLEKIIIRIEYIQNRISQQKNKSCLRKCDDEERKATDFWGVLLASGDLVGFLC